MTCSVVQSSHWDKHLCYAAASRAKYTCDNEDENEETIESDSDMDFGDSNPKRSAPASRPPATADMEEEGAHGAVNHAEVAARTQSASESEEDDSPVKAAPKKKKTHVLNDTEDGDDIPVQAAPRKPSGGTSGDDEVCMIGSDSETKAAPKSKPKSKPKAAAVK